MAREKAHFKVLLSKKSHCRSNKIISKLAYDRMIVGWNFQGSFTVILKYNGRNRGSKLNYRNRPRSTRPKSLLGLNSKIFFYKFEDKTPEKPTSDFIEGL